MAGVFKYRTFSVQLDRVAAAMQPIDERPSTVPERGTRPAVSLLNVSMASEMYCPWLVLIVI
jgi:hypothetical protein